MSSNVYVPDTKGSFFNQRPFTSNFSPTKQLFCSQLFHYHYSFIISNRNRIRYHMFNYELLVIFLVYPLGVLELFLRLTTESIVVHRQLSLHFSSVFIVILKKALWKHDIFFHLAAPFFIFRTWNFSY